MNVSWSLGVDLESGIASYEAVLVRKARALNASEPFESDWSEHGTEVERLPRVGCGVHRASIAAQLEHGSEYFVVLHTTNGAGLSSSSSSESFKVDFGVGKTGPTLIVPDRVPGSRHVNTRVLSNSSVRVEWRTGLQQTLTLSAEQRELYGDDTNVTARNGTTTPLVPMAPLEHFSVNVFVSAHGRPRAGKIAPIGDRHAASRPQRSSS